MARLTDDQKQAILNDIREHILIDGPRNWDKVQERHPTVSRATFFRFVKEVRERLEETAAGSPGAMREVQRRIRERVEAPAIQTERIKAHLPVAPSPAVVAAAPAETAKAFDFFASFNSIVRDAELSRNQNVRKNEDGSEKIVNPAMFDRNIQRRLQILETYLHSMDAVYNMERIRELYDAIIEVIGEESKETQQAILAKLRALNDRRGLTMAARP